jgi:hypothetical protein
VVFGDGGRRRVVAVDDHQRWPAQVGQDADVGAGVPAKGVLSRGAERAPSPFAETGHRAFDGLSVRGRGGDRREAEVVQS